jgi:hypothetical protein
VLPVPQPVAYALGGRAGGVVVSRGLLAVVDDERDAVLAHELAHLRLGRHRLLLFALVIRTTFGTAVPAVCQAAGSLARELEVIADEAAVRAAGDRRMVARALAKAALATIGSVPVLAFGGDGELSYRLDRLTGDRPCEDRRGLAVAATWLLVAELGAVVAVGGAAGWAVGGWSGGRACADEHGLAVWPRCRVAALACGSGNPAPASRSRTRGWRR